jgi:hypothetical protein
MAGLRDATHDVTGTNSLQVDAPTGGDFDSCNPD